LAGDTSAWAFAAWALALVLLLGWLSWFVLGQVTVFEVSKSARLEVQQSANPVAAAVAGKVVESRIVLGQEIHTGDVLVTLDLGREQLRLDEEKTRLAAYEPRLASLAREVASLKRAAQDDRGSADAAIASAKARAREAGAAADFARDNERRLRDESKAGGVAQTDALRAAAEAQKLFAARDAIAADATRIESEARTRRSQQDAQIENLERSIVTLQGEQTTTQSTISRLTQEMEQYVVRSPVDGIVGEVAQLRAGAYINAGQVLATVVPRGGLMVVADFAPAAVLGRMHAGQTGTLRLDGFPWTEFGSIDVRVQRVASEIRDRTVRVELVPLPTAGTKILIQHGLPGTVEIRMEQASPAVLLLRAIGQISPDGILATPKP
jgi:membrane fusion protein (multidrug efflux system)